MASAYKNILTTVGSTGDVTIYTCPSQTTAIVKDLNLYNSHSGTIVVLLKITDSSASATLQKDSIATTADVSHSGPFVLETGDTLLLNCDTASKIMAFANILELT